MRQLSLLFAFAIIGLISCKQSDPPAGDQQPGASGEKAAFMEDIDAARAGELVAADNPPVVVDVRTPEEFATGHIENAINIDFKGDNFKEELAKLDRDKTYLMHCRSGNRSGRAKPTFEELGFKAVYHFDGGMNAWSEAGLPTVK